MDYTVLAFVKKMLRRVDLIIYSTVLYRAIVGRRRSMKIGFLTSRKVLHARGICKQALD